MNELIQQKIESNLEAALDQLKYALENEEYQSCEWIATLTETIKTLYRLSSGR